MTLLLPLLAFLFVSLLVAAGAMALAPSGGRDDRAPPRRSDRRRQAPSSDEPATTETLIDALKRIGAVAPQSAVGDGQAAAAAGRRRLPQPRSADRSSSASALGLRAASCSRCCVDADPDAGRTWSLALGGCGARLPAAEHGARRGWRRSASTGSGSALPDALDLLVVSVEAGPRPRSGDSARRRRAGVRASRPVRRAAADQPRAARRQGARRSAAQPRRPHRRRRHRVARRDAGADRQVRHQRGAVAARALRHAAHQAPAARRRGRGQDRREDGVPARVLHLPGDLGRDDRPGGRSSSSRSSCRWRSK